ncbi:MAG TPA: succinate dehydrogenase [Casimicrobiaceae bacterium]|nr:succinate dehydrogenase [Casimicrobiaceae bacterium]
MTGQAAAASTPRAEAWRWLAQRASAAVLAVCVLVHLGTMLYAVRGGLSAAEILGRTAGSIGWAAFYGLFVVAVAVHAPLGLRTILAEWAGLAGRAVDVLLVLLALGLAGGGVSAITAVVAR